MSASTGAKRSARSPSKRNGSMWGTPTNYDGPVERKTNRELERAQSPGDRCRRFHRQPSRRAPRRAGRRRARLLLLQLERLVGLAGRRRTGGQEGPGHTAGRHPRRPLRGGGVPGRGHRLSSGGAHRHPVQLRGSGELRRHQREGHAQRARGRPARGLPADGEHLHERGLRHARTACPSARPIPCRDSRPTAPRRSPRTSSARPTIARSTSRW